MTTPYGPPPGNQPYPPPYGHGSGPQPMAAPFPQQPVSPQQPAPQQPMPQQGGYPQAMPGQPVPGGPAGMAMAPPPPGMGRVMLDCSYTPLAFMLALFKPGITINGQPGPPAVWGKTPIDLPPGQHHIGVHVNYLWTFGNAVAVVPVNVGQHVDVFYRSPATAFGNGAIGPMPQKTPNLGLVLGLSAGMFVLVLLLVLLPLLVG